MMIHYLRDRFSEKLGEWRVFIRGARTRTKNLKQFWVWESLEEGG